MSPNAWAWNVYMRRPLAHIDRGREDDCSAIFEQILQRIQTVYGNRMRCDCLNHDARALSGWRLPSGLCGELY